jgi:hypothetical protein
MEFTLFKGFRLTEAISAWKSSSELHSLSDHLLRDIGYSRDGRPLDAETGMPHVRPSDSTVRVLAPAMLLLAMH